MGKRARAGGPSNEPGAHTDTAAIGAAPATTEGDTGTSDVRRFFFHGLGQTLFALHIVNLLLTVITLGCYHFWAAARIRRYLFSQTEFAGERFAYHGTGRDLFLGCVKALLLFGLPYVCLNIAAQFIQSPSWLSFGLRWLGGFLLFLYVPVAVVWARRYRCSRTSLRGVRFHFQGSTGQFLRLHVMGWFWVTVSLGMYYPYFLTRRHGFLVSHTALGTHPFRFDGRGGPLVRPFAAALLISYLFVTGCSWVLSRRVENGVLVLLLLPFILGPLWCWFLARKHNFLWNHTGIASSRFVSTVTWQRFLTLHLGNAVLLLCSLGLAWPWVTVRNTGFFLTNLTLHGSVDFERIQEQAAQPTTTGEGMSNLLDTGLDLD